MSKNLRGHPKTLQSDNIKFTSLENGQYSL